jgi:Ca2+-binding RTX toxin-like protein
VAATFALLALPSVASAGGVLVNVSITGDELRIVGQEAAMATQVDYLAGSDEWQVTDPNANALGGCTDTAVNVVECPENDENVEFSFGNAGGSATLAPADVGLDFSSEVFLHQGADTFTGTSGVDVVAPAAVATTASDSVSTQGGADQITTADGDDTVDGGAGNDTFLSPSTTVGGDGADTYIGGADTDHVSYAGRTFGVFADIGGGANDGASGCPAGPNCEGDDIGADVESLTGTSSIDVLIGDADPNQIAGGFGADTLSGGAGAAADGADKLDGGAGGGDDTATYSPAGGTPRAQPISADMDGAADDGAAGENDEIEAVEHLTGGAAGDTLTGNAASNTLRGGPSTGDDVLDGQDGNDTLHGGTGSNTAADGLDTFVGGEGGETNGDRVQYNGRTADLTASIGGGTDADGEAIDATIEQIQGGDGDDTLTGDAQDNIVLGNDGADTIAGGVGDAPDGADTLQGGNQDEATDTLSLATRTTDQIFSLETGNAEGDNPSSFERLLGGSGDDTLSGDSEDETIEGGVGDDTLEGGSSAGPDGADTFVGGPDSPLMAAQGDTVSYALHTSGVLARIGSALNTGNDDIGTDVENLVGSGEGDVLTGDADANLLDGGLGDDTLAGGTGTGADGADTFIAGNPGTNDTVSYATRTTPVVADIGPVGNPANDGAGGCPLGPGCEGDSIDVGVDNLTGGSAADTLTGDSDGNTITGGAGADDLLGLGANDTLDSRDDGPDDLDCGTGASDVAQTDAGLETSIVACETDDTSPRTRVTKKPRKKTTKRKAKFVFDSPTGATEFECVLDRQPNDKRKGGGPDFEPCTSPQVFNGLSRKRHRFEVRAIDGDGDADISPSLVKWKVKKR